MPFWSLWKISWSQHFGSGIVRSETKGKVLGLSRSVLLLLAFNRYCQIKQDCVELHSAEIGAPLCQLTHKVRFRELSENSWR